MPYSVNWNNINFRASSLRALKNLLRYWISLRMCFNVAFFPPPLLPLSSPPDARKNFLIDSVLASTPFSSFLLVSFFPPVFANEEGGSGDACHAYRFPSIGPLSRQKRSSLSFFLEKSVSEWTSNSCYPSRELRLSAARGRRIGRPRQLSLTLSHPRKREREREEEVEEGRGGETRDIQAARAPSPFQP